MKKLSTYCIKYKAILLYLVFGILTTILNMVSYYYFYFQLRFNNILSTASAWFIAVLFAFVTNKYFVFESRHNSLNRSLYEGLLFFLCRLMSGIIDVSIMLIAVDHMGLNSMVWKFISNIVVTIINYVASKLYIFKKNK